MIYIETEKVENEVINSGNEVINCKDDILSLESKVILLILNNPNVTKKQLSMKLDKSLSSIERVLKNH